ncbi:MAG: hypothetical protein JKY81_02135 [Colwellia sp.]|nr:hypothetical protein [Colwellia sp.]
MAVPKRKTAAQKKARELECQIFSNSRANQNPIYEFCKKKYYLDLGHNTKKDWAVANREALGRSYDSINNDYHTACITVDMCGEELIGTFCSYPLLQMKNLSAEERKEVAEHAVEHFELEDVEDLDDTHLTHPNINQFMIELEFIDAKAVESDSDDEESDDNDESESDHSKEDRDFNNALSEAESRHFARRIAIAIEATIEPIKVLRICKFVLKSYKNDHVIEEIEGMIKKLKR